MLQRVADKSTLDCEMNPAEVSSDDACGRDVHGGSRGIDGSCRRAVAAAAEETEEYPEF
jgi:hypothetical protein